MKYPSGFAGSKAVVALQTTASLTMNNAQQARNRRLVCCYYFGKHTIKLLGVGRGS